MDKQPSHNIVEFEGLRGLLALWVLVGHWATSISHSFRPLPHDLWNVQAVDLFIILSGFVISLLLASRPAPFKEYITRRFLRIWPAYAVVLLVSVLTMPFVQQVIADGTGAMRETRLSIISAAYADYWQHLWLHVLLMHGLAPEASLPLANFTFVGQAWSVSLEWQFYLIAPLYFWLLSKRSIIGTLGAVLLTVAILLPGEYMGIGYIGNKLHLFALGAVSYWLWREIVTRNNYRNVWSLRLFTFTCALLVMGIMRMEGLGIALWIICFHVITTAAWNSRIPESWLAAVLRLKPLQQLGYISYTLYISHFLVMVGVMGVLQQFELSPLLYSALLLAGTLVLSLVASCALTVFIERPFMKIARKHSAGAVKIPSHINAA